MAKAPIEKEFVIPGYEDVESGIVKWPLSVIRIQSKDEKRLIELADHILEDWRGYTDEEAFIYAEYRRRTTQYHYTDCTKKG